MRARHSERSEDLFSIARFSRDESLFDVTFAGTRISEEPLTLCPARSKLSGRLSPLRG
jgi:hypothetical protein